MVENFNDENASMHILEWALKARTIEELSFFPTLFSWNMEISTKLLLHNHVEDASHINSINSSIDQCGTVSVFLIPRDPSKFQFEFSISTIHP